MSFYYINYISFKKNGDITVTVADSSLRPLTYRTVKGWNLNDEQSDAHGWLKKFAVSVRDGNYQIVGTKCETLTKITFAIAYLRNKNLHSVLKDNDFGEFVANCVEDINYAIEKFAGFELTIEYAKETIVESSDRWSYLPEEYRNNKELAKFYLEECADTLFFCYPECLLNDKKSVLKAVSTRGVNYRHLYDAWNNDADVVYAAFSSSNLSEHLPDLIGSDLLHDKEFVKKIIIAEPKLHWERFPKYIKEDPEVIEWLSQYNVWYQGKLKREKEHRN